MVFTFYKRESSYFTHIQWYIFLLALIALGVVGFYLQKMNKKEKFMMYRKVHQIIVIIFGIGLFIHLIV